MTSDKQLQNDFLGLLERCRGSIVRLCLIHTNRQPESVKDLFQDIVYNLWVAFPKVRDRGAADSWVYGVALNTARMHRRLRRHSPEFIKLDDAMVENLIDTGEDEAVETLYRLIDRLDDDDKALLFLYIDRVPQKEMAAIFHTTDAAINHRINRLKKKLKKIYENEQ